MITLHLWREKTTEGRDWWFLGLCVLIVIISAAASIAQAYSLASLLRWAAMHDFFLRIAILLLIGHSKAWQTACRSSLRTINTRGRPSLFRALRKFPQFASRFLPSHPPFLSLYSGLPPSPSGGWRERWRLPHRSVHRSSFALNISTACAFWRVCLRCALTAL